MTAAPAPGSGGRLRRWPDLLVAALLSVVTLGPLLTTRGFALVGDMVFVPDQPWKHAWTGGDGGVPRAVPSDAWVSLVDDVVPGEVLQRLVLVGILLGAGWGMSTLLKDLATPARLAGVVLYTWNPFVHERLAIGHWALLCGYAALPFAVAGAVRVREHVGRVPASDWARLAAPLAVAAWTSPTGGVLVWAVVLVLLLGSGRRWWTALTLGLWVNLPWVVPGFANQADQLAPDVFGVEAFAARPDTFLGLWGSLATFGGIWKESIVPDGRGVPVLVTVFFLLVVTSLGALLRERGRTRLPLDRLLLLGGAGLGGAALPGIPATRGVMEWLVLEVPGGGLLRDSQKLLLPWVLVVSVGLALGVGALWRARARFGGHARFWVVGAVLLPLLAFPSQGWGLGGFLSVSEYPAGWGRLAARLDDLDVGEDRVAVLPFSTYRRFAWHDRAVLDPVPRFFPGEMVTDDSLLVPEGRVRGESGLAARVRDAGSPGDLARVLREGGVRWAVVHEEPGDALLPEGATEVASDGGLTWYALDQTGAPRENQDSWPVRAIVLAALDALVLLVTAVLVLVPVVVSRIRRRRSRR